MSKIGKCFPPSTASGPPPPSGGGCLQLKPPTSVILLDVSINEHKKESIIGLRLIGSNCRYQVPIMDSLEKTLSQTVMFVNNNSFIFSQLSLCPCPIRSQRLVFPCGTLHRALLWKVQVLFRLFPCCGFCQLGRTFQTLCFCPPC